MTRQYVGARYVPSFFDGAQGTEWLPNVQYEPLTIVTRNGNSYTSKKAVPAAIGAPENNPIYWASTGIYSAQVEEVRQAILDLQAESRAADKALDNRLTLLDGRRFVFVGDSYGSRPINWIDPLMDKFPTNDCYKVAKGSAGFYATPRFQDVLADSLETIPNRDTITDIVVCGGANDLDPNISIVNLYNAIESFIAYCKTQFPAATVRIGYIGIVRHNWQNGTFHPQEARTLLCYSYGAAQYGGVYLSGVENIHRNMTETVDQTHPTQDSADRLAVGIYQALMGGTAEPLMIIPNGNTTATMIDNGTVTLVGQLFGNLTFVKVPTFRLQNLASFSYTTFNLIAGVKLGDLNFDSGVVHPNTTLTISGTASVDTDQGNSYVIPARFIIEGGGAIKLASMNPAPTGVTETITAIYIREMCATYPTFY